MLALRATRMCTARSKRTSGAMDPALRVNSKDATAFDKKLLDMLRPIAPPPPLPVEEQKRLREVMVRYGKLKRREHLELEKRANLFQRAMWNALEALPHRRKVEALETEPTQFPLTMPIFTDTPPIDGYNIADNASSKS